MLMHMLARYPFISVKARNAAPKIREERKEIHLCVYQHGMVAGLEAMQLGIRDLLLDLCHSLELLALDLVESVVQFLEACIAADRVEEADDVSLGLVVRGAVIPA